MGRAMTLASKAIEAAGLGDAIARRARGEALSPADFARASAVDLLVLGAAADEVRRADVGDEVRVHLGHAPSEAHDVVVVDAREQKRGTELLRHVALARLALPPRGRLCVDFGVVGLEIAQICLAFGASELVGPLATRRGLLLVDAGRALTKRTELAGYITRAQRTPVFVEAR